MYINFKKTVYGKGLCKLCSPVRMVINTCPHLAPYAQGCWGEVLNVLYPICLIESIEEFCKFLSKGGAIFIFTTQIRRLRLMLTCCMVTCMKTTQLFLQFWKADEASTSFHLWGLKRKSPFMLRASCSCLAWLGCSQVQLVPERKWFPGVSTWKGIFDPQRTSFKTVASQTCQIQTLIFITNIF